MRDHFVRGGGGGGGGVGYNYLIEVTFYLIR